MIDIDIHVIMDIHTGILTMAQKGVLTKAFTKAQTMIMPMNMMVIMAMAMAVAMRIVHSITIDGTMIEGKMIWWNRKRRYRIVVFLYTCNTVEYTLSIPS